MICGLASVKNNRIRVGLHSLATLMMGGNDGEEEDGDVSSVIMVAKWSMLSCELPLGVSSIRGIGRRLMQSVLIGFVRFLLGSTLLFLSNM